MTNTFQHRALILKRIPSGDKAHLAKAVILAKPESPCWHYTVMHSPYHPSSARTTASAIIRWPSCVGCSAGSGGVSLTS